jgi:hypothetical protein
MQSFERSEHYTDRDHYAVMTRTTFVQDARLTRIAGHLRRNAEDLAFSTNRPTADNCCIAGAMLGWAFNLAPMRIVTTFDY